MYPNGFIEWLSNSCISLYKSLWGFGFVEAAGTFYFKRKGGRVSLSSSHLCSMVVIYSSTFLFKKKKTFTQEQIYDFQEMQNSCNTWHCSTVRL